MFKALVGRGKSVGVRVHTATVNAEFPTIVETTK